MMSLYLPIGALVAGMLGLIWGADRFVAGSASLARSIGISSLIVGLTIVSIGTSAPEIIISINAALKGSGDLAVGNAIGSNLANIGLVLGITLLIAPIPFKKNLLKEEGLILLLVTGFSGICLYNNFLGRVESILLILLVIPLLMLAIKYKKSQAESSQAQGIATLSNNSAFFSFVMGLAVLLVSAEFTVWGAKSIALSMGISELVIGLTVVAIGTSLPELAASAVSALRGQHDIAIGNIIGSNLFNLLLVMGAAGAISPIALDSQVFNRDYIAMAALTLLTFTFMTMAVRHNPDHAKLPKTIGIILLAAYCLYYLLLWYSTTGG
ncbi:MAG: calcium/sodium antiporter [Porticoccaceae bacterium]|nr:calcium/sodium antiporter [Porticoccaceae bacterium]